MGCTHNTSSPSAATAEDQSEKKGRASEGLAIFRRGAFVEFFFSRANTVDIRHRKTLLDFSMYRLTKFQSGKKKKEKGSKLVSKPNWARGAEAELVV